MKNALLPYGTANGLSDWLGEAMGEATLQFESPIDIYMEWHII